MKGQKVSYFWYRVTRRILSRQSWVILHRPTDAPSQSPPSSNYSIQRAEQADQVKIVDALPSELAGHLPATHRHNLVYGRFKAGIQCVVAKTSSGEVAGGCWCPPFLDFDALAKLGIVTDAAFEITTLFVEPAHRGTGIAAKLFDCACEIMREDGYSDCISLVWYSRPASINAHLKAGFEPIGEKNTYSVAGFRWTRYRSESRVSST